MHPKFVYEKCVKLFCSVETFPLTINFSCTIRSDNFVSDFLNNLNCISFPQPHPRIIFPKKKLSRFIKYPFCKDKSVQESLSPELREPVHLHQT